LLLGVSLFPLFLDISAEDLESHIANGPAKYSAPEKRFPGELLYVDRELVRDIL